MKAIIFLSLFFISYVFSAHLHSHYATLSPEKHTHLVQSSAMGHALFNYLPATMELEYWIFHNSAGVTAVRIHNGVSGITYNTPALYTLPTATSPVVGKLQLKASEIDWLMTGRLYVNVVNGYYGPRGNLRGQILNKWQTECVLTGAASGTGSPAKGFGHLSWNLTSMTVQYNVFHNVANVTAAHIHGPAFSTGTAGVIVGSPSFAIIASNRLHGEAPFNVTHWEWYLQGKTYINVHSATFRGGEIRCQLQPHPTYKSIMTQPLGTPTFAAGEMQYPLCWANNRSSVVVMNSNDNSTCMREQCMCANMTVGTSTVYSIMTATECAIMSGVKCCAGSYCNAPDSWRSPSVGIYLGWKYLSTDGSWWLRSSYMHNAANVIAVATYGPAPFRSYESGSVINWIGTSSTGTSNMKIPSSPSMNVMEWLDMNQVSIVVLTSRSPIVGEIRGQAVPLEPMSPMTCPAGYFVSQRVAGGICSICDAGSMNSVAGAAMCSACPAGAMSFYGARWCSTCPAGTMSQSGSGMCTVCAPGTTNASPFSSSCSACPAGSSSPGGAEPCMPCWNGTYSDGRMSSCMNCPCGRGWGGMGATACRHCPPGMFSYEGLPCMECSPGYFTSTWGNGACTPCPAGTYATAAGSTRCMPCPMGTFSFGWAEMCMECEPGTTTMMEGANHPVACMAL